MSNDKTPVDGPKVAPIAESGDEPEVEGHYMHQLAVEQEARLRQAQIKEARDRSHNKVSDGADSNGIIDRVRRRINR